MDVVYILLDQRRCFGEAGATPHLIRSVESVQGKKMEGRLFREDLRRTAPVGTKGPLHPVGEKRHITHLCSHKVGEPVKTRCPTPPHRTMDIG
jgi:hypothetical protein